MNSQNGAGYACFTFARKRPCRAPARRPRRARAQLHNSRSRRRRPANAALGLPPPPQKRNLVLTRNTRPRAQ
eukprot:9702963-Lingulodinium_polyedra.AAC.1